MEEPFWECGGLAVAFSVSTSRQNLNSGANRAKAPVLQSMTLEES
jgi:hypothetical protein